MRDAVLTLTLLGLLGLAVARPFAGVLIWSWISFMNPHMIVWGFAGSIPWAQLALGATAVGCVIAREPRTPNLNAISILLLIFLAGSTITSYVAPGDPGLTWDYWTRVLKITIGVLLTGAMLTDRLRIHALVWVMVISVGYFAVRGGIATIASGGGARIFGPPNTIIADNNHLAVGILVVMPLMNYLRLHSRHGIVRIGLLAALAISLFAVVGTYSRGALLGLSAVAVVLWWRSHNKIIGGVVLAAAVASAVSFMPDEWVARMNTIQTHEQDESASDRLAVWATAWKLVLSRPLVGVGYMGGYQQAVVDTVDPGGPAKAAHSIWFMVLGEHGFPLFCVWFGMTVVGAVYAQRVVWLTSRRPDLAWAHDLARMTQVSIVAYLVGGTFLSLSYWDLYWTLLLIMGCTHALVLRALQQGERQPLVAAAGPLRAGPAPGWRPALGRQGALRP